MHCLPVMNSCRVDLGFFSRPDIPVVQAPVVITHSLGLPWSLVHIPRPWRGLICINSFTRFVAAEDFPGVNLHWLRRMKRGLQQDPAAVVTDFLRRCESTRPSPAPMQPNSAESITSTSPPGSVPPAKTTPESTPFPNAPRLLEGLEWLEQWDLRQAFATLHCPVLALCGANDPIVSTEHSRACFSQVPLVMIPDAGHLTPLTHAHWLAEEITTALHGRWRS